MRAWLAVVSLAGCDLVFGSDHPPKTPDNDADAPPEEVWTCPALPDFSGWFTAQLPITGVNPRYPTVDLARDQLFFEYMGDIWRTSFANPGTATIEMGLSTTENDDAPALWPDDEHMFVRQGSRVVEGTRDGATWQAAPFVLPVSVGGIMSSPAPTADHGFRVIVAATSGGLVELVRRSPDGEFAEVDTLGNLAALTTPRDPYLSPDGCWLVFSAQRAGSSFDLFASQRGKDGSWKTPIHLDSESAGRNDLQATMTPDGQHLLWTQDGTLLMHAHPM